MKQEVGHLDRFLRITLGAGLIYLAIQNGQSWGYLGVIPLVTGVSGRCPLYRLLGISTACKKCTNN